MALDKYWLEEQLKTTRNLCTIALLLYHQQQDELLPTILELILAEAQAIVDDHCVVREDDPIKRSGMDFGSGVADID